MQPARLFGRRCSSLHLHGEVKAVTYIVGYEYTYMVTAVDSVSQLPKRESQLAYHVTWEDFLRWKRAQPNVKKVEAIGRKAVEYAYACDETQDVDAILTKKLSAR